MSDKPIAVEAKPEVPVVEEFESCSKMEVQVQWKCKYNTMSCALPWMNCDSGSSTTAKGGVSRSRPGMSESTQKIVLFGT